MTKERKVEYCVMSSKHYLVCGTSFTGMLARMCSIADPDGFFSNVAESSTAASAFASSAAASASSIATVDHAGAMLMLC
jgi:hypothetical protein